MEEGKAKAKKTRDIVLRGLGIESPERTVNGWPAVSSAVLQILAGNPSCALLSSCLGFPPPHIAPCPTHVT